MTNMLDPVELRMIDELMKKGVVTVKKFSDRKKYLKELIRRLYLNM